MTKHQKHTKLPLRTMGTFAPNEIAILGSTCGTITDFVNNLASFLKPLSLTYVDASHHALTEKPNINHLTFNANQTITIQKDIQDNKFANYPLFQNSDICFINGNHYQGTHQIVIIDKEKEASLKKRINQLTDVICFVLKDKNTPVFEYLKDVIETVETIPVYTLDEIEKTAKTVNDLYIRKEPQLHGLVLIGGKSERMGSDKSLLQYYGIAQRDYLIKLLSTIVNGSVYVSSRKEQDADFENIITDTFIGLGPLGGICSAFMQHPNNAFLVVATDLPFVNKETLELLISKRNPSKIATTFIGKNNPFPEPLITIWEPKAYPVLLNYISLGYSCPRKVLINSDVELITIDEKYIKNINTPAEFKEAKNQLNQK